MDVTSPFGSPLSDPVGGCGDDAASVASGIDLMHSPPPPPPQSAASLTGAATSPPPARLANRRASSAAKGAAVAAAAASGGGGGGKNGGRRRKPPLSAREKNVRRIESNERERLRMHDLNKAFQVRETKQ